MPSFKTLYSISQEVEMAKVELKQPIVQEISERIKDAQSVVLVDPRSFFCCRSFLSSGRLCFHCRCRTAFFSKLIHNAWLLQQQVPAQAQK